MENTVALAAIGLAGTICAGFFASQKAQNKIHGKISDGLERLAKAHERGNRESAERNGHLGQQNEKIAEMILQQGLADKVALSGAVDKITSIIQHVDEQKVEHQVVRSKE